MYINAITARQIRAARAILDWSQDDLADATQLSIATIRKLELGNISPRQATTSGIRNALEEAGLEFIEPDGVRRRPDEIATYQGINGAVDFFDDIHETIKKNGGDVVMIETSDVALVRWQRADACKHFDRILDLNGSTTIKCLLTEVIDLPLSTPRLEFRFISKHYVDPMPFCVYGDKFAMVAAGNKSDSRIIVMRSPCAVHASKRQFFSMWDKATPLAVEKIGLDRVAKSRSA